MDRSTCNILFRLRTCQTENFLIIEHKNSINDAIKSIQKQHDRNNIGMGLDNA